MNLKEVKKHVYLQIAIYIGIGLCLLLSLFAILITPTKAAELKSTNITGTIKNTSNCGSGEWNKFCYYQGQLSEKATFGSNLGYAIDGLSFDLSGVTIANNSPSTIEIYNALNTFSNVNYSCSFAGSNQPVNCSVSRVSNNRINVNFKTVLGAPQGLYIYMENGYNWTGINGININKVMLLQTVEDPNANVIENANQNTDNIINNNNENTQQIIDAINNNTADLCTNMFNYADYYINDGVDNVNVTPNNLMLQTSNSWASVKYKFPVESGKTYYFKGSFTSAVPNSIFLSLSYDGTSIVNTRFWNYEPSTNNINAIQTGNWSTHFTADRTGYVYLGIWVTKGNSSNNASYFEMTFNQTDDPWCAFGTYVSKLDKELEAQKEANRILNELGFKTDETNAYLKDDSDPTLNEEGIDDVLGEVEIDDPLNYLLTLPISLLQKLNTVLSSNTCQRVSFGSLYNTELYLPCIDFSQILGSSIWGTIDLIVGVGLLAIILKRFYESISNILTLGKEKEVKDKLDLPTPMEFLAHIIGGGRD